MSSVVNILGDLRSRLEQLRAVASPEVIDGLRSGSWREDGYVPVIADLMSGGASVEMTLARVADLHTRDSVDVGALTATVSDRIEELVRAARVDEPHALDWDSVEAALLRHWLASHTRHTRRGPDASPAAGDPGEVQVSGISPAIRELRGRVARCARGQGNILVTGETGVGKERVVRAIHALSSRCERPLVVINCAAIAPGLVDSELFGHRKGSFTGATRDYSGVFRAADGGTLFLDEIGEMPPETQARLLRAMEERAVRPVGDVREYSVDVRVVSATNRDLDSAVAEDGFRRDLYYRLRVHHLTVPPLRERNEDIPLLIAEFLTDFESMRVRIPRPMSDRERSAFVSYPWPGNIRQLRACIEEWVDRAGTANFVLPRDVQQWCAEGEGEKGIPRPAVSEPIGSLDAQVDDHVRQALVAAGGNRTRAAEILGISRSRLYRALDRIDSSRLPCARRGRPQKK